MKMLLAHKTSYELNSADVCTAGEISIALDHEYRAPTVSSENFEVVKKGRVLLCWVKRIRCDLAATKDGKSSGVTLHSHRVAKAVQFISGMNFKLLKISISR